MQINVNAAGFKRLEDLNNHELFIKFEDIRTGQKPSVYLKLDSAHVACIGYQHKVSMSAYTFVFPVSIDAIGIKKG